MFFVVIVFPQKIISAGIPMEYGGADHGGMGGYVPILEMAVFVKIYTNETRVLVSRKSW